MSGEEKPSGITRILVVDDHPILRRALIELIGRHPDLVVCAEADSVGSAEAAIGQHQPDLILLDLRLGTADSVEFIKSLRRRFDDLHILVLSQHDEMIFAERCLRAGADGYVVKQEAAEEVVTAIRAVLAGDFYLNPEIGIRIDGQDPRDSKASECARLASLSDRELYVFELLGMGLTTQAIALDSHLSAKTIESHRENIKHKLGLRDREALIECARKWVQGPE